MRWFLFSILMLMAVPSWADRLTLLANPYGGLLLAHVDVFSTGTSHQIITESKSLSGNSVFTTTTLTLTANPDNPRLVGWTIFKKDCNLPGEWDSENRLVGGFLTVTLRVFWGSEIGSEQVLWKQQVPPILFAAKSIEPDELVSAIWRIGVSKGWSVAQRKAAIAVFGEAVQAGWITLLRRQFDNVTFP